MYKSADVFAFVRADSERLIFPDRFLTIINHFDTSEHLFSSRVHLARCWSSQTPGLFLIWTRISDNYGSTIAPCSKIQLLSAVECALDSEREIFTLARKAQYATCHLYLATSTLRDYGRVGTRKGMARRCLKRENDACLPPYVLSICIKSS